MKDMNFSFINDEFKEDAETETSQEETKAIEPEVLEPDDAGPDESLFVIKPLDLRLVIDDDSTLEEKLDVLYKKVSVELTDMEAAVEDLNVYKGNLEHADEMKGQLSKINSALESKRSDLKAPSLDEGKIIDGFAKKIRDRVSKMKLSLGTKMLPIIKKIKAENARLDAAKKQTTKRVEKKAIEKKKTTVTNTHIRENWVWEITDEAKVPRQYLSINNVSVNKAVRAGKRSIDGLRIYKDEKVV